MSKQEETPDCLHIGPSIGPFDNTEHKQKQDAELGFYEYSCSMCSYARECRWAESMRIYWGYSLEDEDFYEGDEYQ